MTHSDVFFTFSVEMLDDAVQREFCRPPDQTLLALAGDDQVGRLLVADSWRSVPVSLLRRRPVQPREQITIAGRAATRLRLYRLRIGESTSLGWKHGLQFIARACWERWMLLIANAGVGD
jgi:teichuronic acid biosynthesis glycosyltransferase TuaH